MSPWDFSTGLALGAVSSLHCAQMCGPLVLTMAAPGRSLAPQLAYHAGRIGTYSMLGALAGAAGGGASLLGHLTGVEKPVAITLGLLTLAAGIWMALAASGSRLVQIGGGAMPRLLSRGAAKLLMNPSVPSKLLLGGILGFLPCGLIYAALLKALSTGEALGGAFTMLGFGFGTAGALLAIGLAASAVKLRFGRWSDRLAAASVILLGVFLVWRGAMMKVSEASCHVHGI